MPTEWAHYRPTWVGWSITGAALAGLVLIYLAFGTVFSIVSIWETCEDADASPGTHTADYGRHQRRVYLSIP